MKFLTPIILLAISVAMYFMYIDPISNEVKGLSQQKAQFTDVLEKSKELKARRDQLLSDYNNIPESEISRLNKIVPDTFTPELFVNDMNFLASKHNLKINDFKITPVSVSTRDPATGEVPIQNYQVTAVAFKLTGSYDDFILYLVDLESSLHLVDVVNLGVHPVSSTKTGEQILDFALSINTYSIQ